MTTGVIVGSIFLSADQKLWVEELTVFTSADFVNWRWVEINEDGSWDVFAAAGLAEEGVVRTAVTKILGIWVRTSIWKKTVLEKVTTTSSTLTISIKYHAYSQFPSSVTKLDTSLADVKVQNLKVNKR